jgi:hypothetical protein
LAPPTQITIQHKHPKTHHHKNTTKTRQHNTTNTPKLHTHNTHTTTLHTLRIHSHYTIPKTTTTTTTHDRRPLSRHDHKGTTIHIPTTTTSPKTSDHAAIPWTTQHELALTGPQRAPTGPCARAVVRPWALHQTTFSPAHAHPLPRRPLPSFHLCLVRQTRGCIATNISLVRVCLSHATQWRHLCRRLQAAAGRGTSTPLVRTIHTCMCARNATQYTHADRTTNQPMHRPIDTPHTKTD